MSEKKKRPTDKNLKPFKKGQSGNPNGRPIGAKSMKTRAVEMLSAMSDDKEYATPLITALLNVLDEKSDAKASERIKSVEVLRDTIEGKPTQKVEQTNEDVTKRDLSKLTKTELKAMEKIQDKITEE